jgi:predicted nucleotidyltransferase
MNLTSQQLETIRQWCDRTQYVREVRLFGSRARGDATEKSDIDLAVTIDGDEPGTVLGIYYARSRKWQEDLTSLLRSKVHVGLYDDPENDIVQRSCDECSVVLFP